MLIAGAVLVVLGAVGIVLAHRSRSRLHAMIAADTLPVRELEEHRRTLADLGSAGSFRKVCEVVGQAAPHPDGPLRSDLTGTECVWHRHTTTRRYRVTERDSDGDWRTTERTQTVVDQTSAQGYAIVDGTGIIGVDPNGTTPDAPERVAQRFEPVGAQHTGLLAAVAGGFGGHQEETIGFTHEEWVIRPGQQLYVLGEVHDRIGPLVIGRPDASSDPFIISTRSEAELRAGAQRTQRWWAWGGGALGAVGVVLLVLGIVL